MKSLILTLLLISTLAAQQQVVVVSRGRTDGGSGISGCPAAGPAFIMTVGVSGAAYAGTDGSGTVTRVGTTIVENPASSGRYVMRFDGVNDDARMGTGLDSLTDLTVCGWFAIDLFTAGVQQLIVKAPFGAGNQASWSFFLRPSTFNSFAIAMQNTASAVDQFNADAELLAAFDGTGEFIHLCGKLTNCAGMACAGQLYLNGAPVTTTFGTDSTGTLRDDTTFTVLSGANGAADNDYDGDIAGNLEVWTPSISDACVAERFATGRP
jgi:hypothetical protein